ncbi:hypothetical protein NT6N_31490 [Oceaniferula spumae]|uniref:GYF domain-containing protein n=1 Tax=Oceaniferula spumae TaxID=2979115 RepID=A0AAT9FQ33_9BACT
MSEQQQWYYIDAAGQQVGPIAGEQLHDYVSAGHITADSQLWTEGMEEWLPASQFDGLIPAAPAAPVATPQINLGPQTGGLAAATRVNPYASPAASAAPQAGGDYPIPMVNKINFGLFITCLLGGIALMIIGSMLIGASSPTAAEMNRNPNALKESGSVALPMTVLLLGIIVLLISSIIQFMAIYRAWAILKPGGGSISPGAAVGLLFIPFFGSIWMIIVLCKLPGEWNSIVARYNNTAGAPRLSVGIAICVILIPLIGQILWMNEIAKAINFMASSRLMPKTQQPTGQGGIVLR